MKCTIFSRNIPKEQFMRNNVNSQVDIQLQLREIITTIINVPKMLKTKQLIPILRSVFPVLKPTSKKGQNGRIAVIGGSFEFTGAPFYAAISSLKVGGDLAHIFCSKSASPAIKSYSPEVIVHPVFDSEAEIKYTEEELKIAQNEWLQRIFAWKSAIHSWVIGPGLGRDKYMHSFFPQLVKNLPEGCLAVFDADAIYFLSQHPQLISQLKRFRTVLTPNAREMTFLKKLVDIDVESIYAKYQSNEEIQQIPNLEKFGDFTIFVKGYEDLILSNKKSFIVRTTGGDKRCGGLGDILAGSIAVCNLWNEEYGLPLASTIVRSATRVAFEKQGRGLTAPMVLKELPNVVMKMESASL